MALLFDPEWNQPGEISSAGSSGGSSGQTPERIPAQITPPTPAADGKETSRGDELPAWAREFVQTSARAAPEARASPLSALGQPTWPLFVDAAVVSSFLPRDLAPDSLSAEQRAEAEQSLLQFSETTLEPDGAKWCLTRGARTQILNSARTTEELWRALERTAEKFPDPVSRALRGCLRGEAKKTWFTVDLPSMEALRKAVSWLGGVEGLELPPIQTLDREIEFRRFLAQFERMTGDGGQNGIRGPSRFFGRRDDLERLRQYVGVIAADSLRQSAKRAIKSITRLISGRAPLSIWGIGGAGKTTLIAKFMLEHVHAASSLFPFAYLDFDRSTVSAGNLAGVLAEMCNQVAMQFAGLAGPMSSLKAEVLQVGALREGSAPAELVDLLWPHLRKFREIVDRFLGDSESAFEWARPFLLVFDTFEIVQYNSDHVAALQDFVRCLSAPGETGLWPRLCLILSGRQFVPDFVSAVDELKLGALDVRGSVDMLLQLTQDADRPISRAQAEALVAAVAQRGEDDVRRGVLPLRLRLIGEVFRRMEIPSGPAIVQSLLNELNDPTLPGIGGQVLINGILVRRILGHVRDARVRALTDPGLVVRYITPDVIREVMTVGAPVPRPDTDDIGDEEGFESWVVSEDEAKAIFNAFAREVALVEREGNALRHRQDVRNDMLPLIRARRPKRFLKLHSLALNFFSARAKANPEDLSAAAEAIYHGLWLEQPIESIDAFWPADPGFNPRIDPEEFARDTLASSYLRARTGSRLTVPDVGRLPGRVVIGWLVVRAGNLLREPLLDRTIATIRAAAGPIYEGIDGHPQAGAVVARALYRAGSWNEAADLIQRHVLRGYGESESQTPSAAGRRLEEWRVSMARMHLTLFAKSPGTLPELDQRLMQDLTRRGPVMHAETLAHSAIGLIRRDPANPEIARLRAQTGEIAREVPAERWKRDIRILRLALLTSTGDTRKLLATYVSQGERLAHDRDVLPAIAGILTAVNTTDGVRAMELASTQYRATHVGGELDAIWRSHREQIATAVQQRPDLEPLLRRIVVYDHFDWTQVFANALNRELERDRSLMPMLETSGFEVARRTPKNGLQLARRLVIEGRILDLAHTLLKRRETIQAVHPQDVYGISGALLGWHELLLQLGERAGRVASR